MLLSETTTPGRVSFEYQTWTARSAWLRLFRATVTLPENSNDTSHANPVTVDVSTRPFETSMRRMPAKPSPGGWWTNTSRMMKLASVSRMKMASIVSTFVISHPAMRYGSSGVPWPPTSPLEVVNSALLWMRIDTWGGCNVPVRGVGRAPEPATAASERSPVKARIRAME